MDPCWFCLGGSKIEKQYIVSIGSKVRKFKWKSFFYFKLSVFVFKVLFSLCKRSIKC